MAPSSCLLDDSSDTSLARETQDSGPQETVDEVALLFEKPRQTIVPLWEIQLVLKKEAYTEKDDGTLESHPLNLPPTEFHVSTQPSSGDFTGAFSHLLEGYLKVVKGFSSFMKDERVTPFVSRSKYDLLMVMEEEAERPRAKRQVAWPDVSSLVCGYTPYRATVDYITRMLQATLVEVDRLSTVSEQI